VAPAPPPKPDFVFGYGSLATLAETVPTRAFHPRGFVADLHGLRRCWGVAMNNRLTLPGYKYYLDEHGNRPALHVAFLDLRPDRQGSVNGVCMPASREQLARLDDRERSYVRRDVTALCHLPRGAEVRVWAYLGTVAGRRRLARARAAGRAAIDRGYLESVTAAFKRLGSAEYAACAASLDPGELPVLALSRHDLASTTIAG
jgi:cation transport regulator ChaC